MDLRIRRTAIPDHMGTDDLRCPAERSFAILLPARACRASLDLDSRGRCPHVVWNRCTLSTEVLRLLSSRFAGPKTALRMTDSGAPRCSGASCARLPRRDVWAYVVLAVP